MAIFFSFIFFGFDARIYARITHIKRNRMSENGSRENVIERPNDAKVSKTHEGEMK